MTDLVDQMFPRIYRKWAAGFTDFNYWKAPIQEFALLDFTLASPALSARLDTSNQSTLARLRNFSLVGRQQRRELKHFSPPVPATATALEGSPIRAAADQPSAHLRQLSSLERPSSRLAAFTQSSSSSIGMESRSSSSSSPFVDSDKDEGEGCAETTEEEQ
ncbi:hypothetical protein K503DRAFT_29069 [Rhizopogon vinicolor AM-OR11-026]|uniref:Uncharacterized protein n=1 Tax=Rhizopogon vinicolor AM-OR11-026 TaxID=1314800 RepID=A0A1B7MHC2_9AGAM|nr:hypothetical protein K503DRAFT_29069 [Rhizopogon vinicolor AM-OR11-026]